MAWGALVERQGEQAGDGLSQAVSEGVHHSRLARKRTRPEPH
jgi:hypothetical protein